MRCTSQSKETFIDYRVVNDVEVGRCRNDFWGPEVVV